jgi:hypothetical protein
MRERSIKTGDPEFLDDGNETEALGIPHESVVSIADKPWADWVFVPEKRLNSASPIIPIPVTIGSAPTVLK